MFGKIVRYASPVMRIIICSAAAVLLNPVMGKWVFVPVFILYWGLSVLITLRYAGIAGIKIWLKKPAGKIIWLILALIAGFIPLQILLSNAHLLTVPLIFLSLPFVVLNPFFEELYWRGFVLDFTFKSRFLSSLYSCILFILSHLFIWGVFSYGNRNYFLIASLAIMSAVWCLVRLKTKSLWWCIVSHFFVDVFNLMVPVMLNIVIPEQGYISVLELLFGVIK